MAATLFHACKEGRLSVVKEILDENKPDLEAKDAHGLTALMYAAQEGHVDVVQELLSRGARPEEAANHDHSKDNAEIASMLSSAVHNATGSTTQTQPAPAFDSIRGQHMPEGSVGYARDGGVHPDQQAELAIHPHQLQHPYIYPPSFFDPTSMGEQLQQQPQQQQRGHAHKDSSAANLPPPEVARLIPCKFFPNCRYGDKCLFAHPAPLPPASNATGPVSPGQAPVFYQPPPGYGYTPYGPPQHFYSIAPPMPMQYAHAGVPMPVHMPLPPHMAGPHVSEQAHLGQADSFNPAFHSQPQYFPPVQAVPGYAEAEPSSQPESHDAAASEPGEGTDAANVGVATEASSAAQPNGTTTTSIDAKSGTPDSAAQQSRESAEVESEVTKSTHRRQSFNSFLHHHAIPFQPSQSALQLQPQLNGDAGFGNTAQPHFPRGVKGPRRGGASLGGSFGGRPEFNGNKRADRPTCYFFIRGVCKHGEECRFPHILPDGSDARGPNGGKASGSIDASRGTNRALAAKNARHASHAPTASTTGPGSGSSQGPASVGKKSLSANVEGLTSAPTPAVSDNAAGSATPSDDHIATKSDKVQQAAGAASKEAEKRSIDTKANSAKSAPAASSSTNSDAAAVVKPTENKETLAYNSQIPSKPPAVPNGTVAPRVNGSQPQKPQVSGVNGHKGSQQSFANGTRSAFGRPGNSGHGRSNGQQNGLHPNANKKVAQRVPNPDDFPALPNGHVGAASSNASPSASNGTQKVNFSAILSAPAPVRKMPEPKTAGETNGSAAIDGNSDDHGDAKDENVSLEAQPSQTVEPAAETAKPSAPDFATVAQAKAVAV